MPPFMVTDVSFITRAVHVTTDGRPVCEFAALRACIVVTAAAACCRLDRRDCRKAGAQLKTVILGDSKPERKLERDGFEGIEAGRPGSGSETAFEKK